MKRRSFIKSSLLTTVPASVLTTCHNEKEPLKDFISGFIISDAHIGWRGKDQPSLDEQSKAMQVIRKKFPNLDLLFDTGDVHHGYLDEDERVKARDHWLTNLVNPFSDSIFHYIPGNHELQKGPYDTELTAGILGSHNFRPYYSFDFKGVHFISLPQLRDTVLITKESLDWLEHDLQINRSKTTLVFSHNSISNTTFTNGESSYREVINSDDVLNILDRHNNVVGWFHGHNHQYEIVNKESRLYVSNGRIGGFNPPKKWGEFGQGHLGGIYFEINENGLKVSCFSATANDFLSELGFKNLSQTLDTPTSFEKRAGLNYYFGHGNLTNNVSHEINNYYLSNEKTEVFTKKVENEILNENSNFKFPSELSFSGKAVNRVVGYHLRPRHLKTKTVDEGVLVKNEKGGMVTLTLPSMKVVKGNFLTRPGYFRCESGDQFSAELEFRFPISASPDAKVIMTHYVFDEYHSILYKSDSKEFLASNVNNDKKYFDVPYNLESKGNMKYLKVGVEMIDFPAEFVLSKFVINKTAGHEINATLQIGNSAPFPVRHETKINSEVLNKGTSSLKYLGSETISCIVKVRDIDWQIRNAVSSYEDSTIKLLKYGHNFQNIPEVVLTPAKPMDLYLNKVVDLMPLEVSYIKNGIVVSLTNLTSEAKLVFQSKITTVDVNGGELISHDNGLITIVPKTKVVIIKYSI